MMMKKILKALLILLSALLAAGLGLFLYLAATEYKPADAEPAELTAETAGRALAPGDSLSLLSLNIGYAGLDAGADFFLDGGTRVRAASKEQVEENLAALAEIVSEQAADITLLQEVDADSARSYRVDQRPLLGSGSRAFALNYRCDFVPYPWPPIGRTRSGLLTVTGLEIASATRLALPCPFSWPMRAANLKRCLLVTELPLSGTDRKLMVVNLHLEAYDDGAGKRAQTEVLRAFLEEQYAAGNYVVAGGDFNQTFPGALERWPVIEDDYWAPGTLEELLPEGWAYAFDAETPTCRLLNQPLDPDDPLTQYYVIDGYILSPNVELLRVETLDLGFEHSDHNPVRLELRLK